LAAAHHAVAAATTHAKPTAFRALEQHDADQAKRQDQVDDENDIFHMVGYPQLADGAI
jgi:hypothetical protein